MIKRNCLGALLTVVLSICAAPASAQEQNRQLRFPPVLIEHPGNHGWLSYQLYNEQGYPIPLEVARLTTLLRCHHTGAWHPLHPRLVQLIYRVARHFPAQTLEVVAGYRHPRVARQKGVPHSYHTYGRAADLRVPDISAAQLRDYLRTFPDTGVGYYPELGFVHLDVRKHSAYWVNDSWRQHRRYARAEAVYGTFGSRGADN